MKRCAIIGSGDLGQLIAYHGEQTGQYQVVGYFNDFLQPGERVGHVPILGGQAHVESQFKNGQFDELFIGIGYRHLELRTALFKRFSGHIPFGKMIHPSAYVDPSCHVGEGAVLLPGCVLDRNVSIGPNVLLNTGVRIAHDSRVGGHTFVAPAVAMAGFVQVGQGCNLGINTTVIDNITIVDGVRTGGGTVVIKNLIESGLYVGAPARFIR